MKKLLVQQTPTSGCPYLTSPVPPHLVPITVSKPCCRPLTFPCPAYPQAPLQGLKGVSPSCPQDPLQGRTHPGDPLRRDPLRASRDPPTADPRADPMAPPA